MRRATTSRDEPGDQPGPVARDAWFTSEPSTRIGMIAELQRIKRRTWIRPLPVLALAAAITGGILYKVATKPVSVEAEVVLALAEGTMANRRSSLPVDQLREYVSSVLLSDNKLTELIEKRDLYRLRKKFGPEFAIEELRSAFDIQIWKNSFVYYDEDDGNARRSARIGITVHDADADRAYDLAHDLASIAIRSAAVQRQQLATAISAQVALIRDGVEDKLIKLADETSLKQAAIDAAAKRDRPDLAGILRIDLAALNRERRRLELQLAGIATSNESLASEISAAGLDMSLSIVSERRPEHPTRAGFVLAMVAAVVGTGALVGSALVLGAFDSRVHDTDDVARLGLPVLGQVPRFAGDSVGSMSTRGAAPTRVPSFVRWRSHR
jgi:hypothetical protein